MRLRRLRLRPGPVLTTFICASALLAATLVPLPAARAASGNSFASEFLQAINGVRRSHGLAPLRLSTRLTEAAVYHNHQMVRYGYFGHDSPNGAPFWVRIERWYPAAGARRWAVGENILWNTAAIGAGRAVSLWLGSAEHRAILLGASWREVGVAELRAASPPGLHEHLPATIVTADFGVRSPPPPR